jgi:hypothetical protein
LASFFLDDHWIIIAGTLSGLILMFSIDAVYYFADKNGKVILHSGQVFLSSLLVISFVAGYIIPFIFLALIKLLISSKLLIRGDNRHWSFGLRFLRLALLLLTGIALVLSNGTGEYFVLFLFLSGELADRILFYADFNPLNINNTINNHIKTQG